jgi:formylglycine-generating enzyme required for sulfatase activity
MPKLFISYRRKDAPDITGRLNDRLKSHFGEESVFLDIDSIPIGLDFRKQIGDAVSQCDVLLAVIGKDWLDVKYEDGPEKGKRRLENPNDLVRVEIHSALTRGIPVVPVLVGDVKMPTEAELPDDIKELAFRNAAVVRSHEDFHSHVDRVIRGLEKLVQTNRDLKVGMQKASHLADENPDLAIHSARKLIESVVRETYERRFNEPPGARPLKTLAERLVKSGFFPERYAEALAIQNPSLPQLMEVLQWYVKVERPDALGDLPARTTAAPATTPSIQASKISVVPKGLRSFDAHDADFFLDLLPGPRDKDGLPESISFWKHRIENQDEATFTVGLIYGPSGCGKSSLVKAGLLPRLSGDVISVHVEATADETESRLLNGLRKRCPSVNQQLGLKDTVAALHQNHGIPEGKKVLIVLDQFEQWLHAKRSEENTELVEALRQCDGNKVQCIVMVRDDFWMAVTRFFRDLDIPLVEGQNFKAVDLFPLWHARQVLAAFGRAYGGLPAETGNGSGDHKLFLDQAIAGLAEDGKVICVRLSLFAEMMKGKPWTPATLKEVGGTEGVGVTFLEETFSAASAPPEHRFHQKAARSVLKALLPESGTDIKGHMRSYADLLEASGYSDRPKDFADLIRILDSEIRLITPTDPEGKEGADGSAPTVKAGEKYYQLTHDYLVPSLRAWLTRKQRETRKGRAELRLAERSALWNAKPENQQLPSLWAFLNIRLLADRKHWTEPQRKMMGKAGRVHGIQSGVAFALLLALCLSGLAVSRQIEEKQQADHAASLVEQLVKADIAQVPGIVEKLAGYRRWADPLLHDAYVQAERDRNRRNRLHISLALLPVDAGQVDYLYGRLLDAEPQEVPVVVRALDSHKVELLDRLWALAESQETGKESPRLPAAAALAIYDPKSEKWVTCSPLVVHELVLENPIFLGQWSEAFRPVKDSFLAPLAEIFRDQQPERAAERTLATNLLADYAADQPQLLANLLMEADEKQFAVIYPIFQKQGERGLPVLSGEIDLTLPPDAKDDAKEKLAKRQANAAVALLRMNQPAKVWPLLKHDPDPSVRTYLIHGLGPLGADPMVLVHRLDEEADVSSRRALILSLGEFDTRQLPTALRQPLVAKLLEIYQHDPDAGLHGASEWLLRQWDQGGKLSEIDSQIQNDASKLQARKAGGKQQWYVNTQDQTFVILNADKPFSMGSPLSETDHRSNEAVHNQRIGRTFAIASKEVTKGQFRRFQQANPDIDEYNVEQYSRTDDSPQVAVDWYDAARYCNWLSKVEGIKEAQWCYEPNSEGKYAEGMQPAADYLQRGGYRLPTEAEWEFACRSGAVTSRYFGPSVKLLPKYAWFLEDADSRSWPAGMLKPNEFGLFDMLGNAYEWCGDGYRDYPVATDAGISEDSGDTTKLADKVSRVLRGGAFNNQPEYVRSAFRDGVVPTDRGNGFGFRPSRTYP